MESAPSPAIASPLTTPTARATPGVTRARIAAVSVASTAHHAADPAKTPATTAAGLTRPPLRPAPSPAASAANEMIVAGLVLVRPRVDAYADARPRAVGGCCCSAAPAP